MGVIVLVFVFMGMVPDQMGSPLGGSAAIVNGTNISVREFRNFYDAMIRNVPEEQKEIYSVIVRQNVIQQLVTRELLSQFLEESGFVVSKRELRDRIVSLPFFQGQKFNRLLYENFLRQIQSSPEDFETNISKDILLERFQRLVSSSLELSQEEKKLLSSPSSYKANFRYVKIKESFFNKKSVSKKSILSFLKRKDANQILKDTFLQSPSRWEKENQVRARHILIKFSPQASLEEKEKALERIKEIRQMSKSEDFAKLAKKYSDGPTKVKGGDLGYFKRGMMVKEFERVAFGLKKGQVSEPFKTIYGYHILKVEDKKGKSFEDQKEDLARFYLSEKKADGFKKELKEVLKEGSSPRIESLFKKHGIKWRKRTRALGKRKSKDGRKEVLISKALSLKIPGTYSKLFEHDGDQYVLRFDGLSPVSSKNSKKEQKKMKALVKRLRVSALSEVVDRYRKKSKLVLNEKLLGKSF